MLIQINTNTVKMIYQQRLLSLLTQHVINQEIQMILKIQMIPIFFLQPKILISGHINIGGLRNKFLEVSDLLSQSYWD